MVNCSRQKRVHHKEVSYHRHLQILALDGLNHSWAERFKRRFINYKTFHYKVNLIRYADDFIITGRDKELLETRSNQW